ncbi:MAG: N-acetylmuramoyl-L-alanine amidase [Solibacillus sp.]
MNVLLDYGHGGTDPGAVYKGRREADDVLRLGQAVAHQLRVAGVKVAETRTKDSFLSLEQRVKIEHAKSYDLVISIHRNAFKPEAATGAEVFVYNVATSKAKPVATAIQKAFVQVGFKDRGVKQANFYVLKHTKAPALLLEVGFIDNSKDNALFDAKFDEIVRGISHAILQHTVAARSQSKVCASCGQIVG